MDTTAKLRGVRLSAQKGRLVADLIRGKSVEQRAQHPAVQPEEGRRDHPQGARVGDRQRRAQRRRRHRRAQGDARSASRRDRSEALHARAKGRGNAHPEAHLPHLSHRRRRKKRTSYGSEDTSDGFPPRAEPQLGFALVREQQELLRACCSRTSRSAISSRRSSATPPSSRVVIERPAKNARITIYQRASRRGDRQEGRGHRVAQGAAPAACWACRCT